MSKLTKQMRKILNAWEKMHPVPIETLSAKHARLMPSLSKAALAVYDHNFFGKAFLPMQVDVGKIEHKIIPGVKAPLMTRIYTPKGVKAGKGWPVLIYFPGGGWVTGNLDDYDASCRALCDAADILVMSVHYSQAPEDPWPAAIQDAYAAYKWVTQYAIDLEGDPDLIMVAGEGAGGNLATVLCQILREKGGKPPLHQLLIYPVTDLAEGANSVSAREFGDAKPLNRAMLSWFYDRYVPKDFDRYDPYISPIYGDLHGLPPATIILAEIDPLRDDGRRYAAKLRQSNVAVNAKTFEGVTHEFFGLKGFLHEASEAVQMAVDDLRFAIDSRLQETDLEITG